MTVRNYKLTLEQLRMAARKYKRRTRDPCQGALEKVIDSMQPADYDIRGMWKYVKELEKCKEENPNFDPLKEKRSTMFFLNKYLDRQKTKRK